MRSQVPGWQRNGQRLGAMRLIVGLFFFATFALSQRPLRLKILTAKDAKIAKHYGVYLKLLMYM